MSVHAKKFQCQRGGLTIRGTEYRGSGENLPIAVVSHGFLANSDSTKGYAKQLAELGYAAYCFDFCGGCLHGRSGGATVDMTVLTEVEDLKAVIQYARSLPGNDPGRLTLMGCSQGGFVSALTAAELGDQVERLVLFYPALCIPDDARAGKMLFFRFDPANIPEVLGGGPVRLGRDYAATMLDVDPFAAIAPYRGPVLIVHGDKDEVVHPDYARGAAAAYEEAAPRRCSLAVLQGAGHGFAPSHDADAMALVREFLAGRSLVLSVDVSLTGRGWTWTPLERTTRLPFTGHAVTSWFTGEVLPGAADTQRRTPGGRRFCADYTLEGKDYTGAPCRVHIVNVDEGRGWTPTVDTDSEALSFLKDGGCTACLEQRPQGPVVRIFAPAAAKPQAAPPENHMRYRTDRYGNKLSILGLGCMRFHRSGNRIDMAEAERVVMAAYERGVNYFDTAYVYPGSEAALGEILEKNGIRDRVNIATKLPHYLIRSREALEKRFTEQLQRLRTDHIDYYLMHMLSDTAAWERLKGLGIVEWLEEKRRSGAIRQVGFSYHGGTDTFCRLVDAYDWDFCQIQYNYLDRHTQAGERGLRYAHEKGLPVIIMEPLRGGKLVRMLPEEAKAIFDAYPVQYTPAQWAFRWLWDQPEVTCVLSGMNTVEMVLENTETASQADAGCMTPEDGEMLQRVAAAINGKLKVGCTGCGYCMPCPQGVDIPGTFAAYNRKYTENGGAALREYLMGTAFRGKSAAASNCVGCGRCESHCPQGIAIRQELKNAASELEGPTYKAASRLINRLHIFG